ncbi:MAG: YhjD/YihY/BrkB family envelope integrity protein [bacterium]|nr:YhjD/YihY/BrkB family envelope integrity protein [bacterium]MDT8367539.1 YhjD/YihY/BrkB family envelope integrity protein [bacterium]
MVYRVKESPEPARQESTGVTPGNILFFLKTGVWRVRKSDVSILTWFFIKVLRILLLTFRGFVENKCQLRASSLTFYSLLSIVPVMAMAFGVAKGFGFQKTLEREIGKVLSAHSEIASQIMNFANSLLDNTKGGLVAGIGFAFLVWAVLKVLFTIEQSFNEIWGVQEPRNWVRKVSDYLSLMFLLPVLFLLSSAATVVVASHIQTVAGKVGLLGYLGPLTQVLIWLLPLVVIWLMFTLLYIFMPNTQVRIRPALIAGIAAGTAFQLFQYFYVTFQIGMAKYNAIYGSFAALPLFLIWLQASWMIVLSGAELSFATQNVDTYEFEPDANLVSDAFRKLLALRIVNLLVEHFSLGEKPLDEDALAHELGIPIRLLRYLLHDLSEAGVITSVRLPQERIYAYQPAFDPDAMTIATVLESLENTGTDNLPVLPSPELDQIRRSMEIFSEENRASEANRLLKEIGEGKSRVQSPKSKV